jgi:hypothetical protein
MALLAITEIGVTSRALGEGGSSHMVAVAVAGADHGLAMVVVMGGGGDGGNAVIG